MQKEDKRGRYMSAYTPEQRTEIMRTRAKERWASVSEADRKKYGRMLVESRKKKNV